MRKSATTSRAATAVTTAASALTRWLSPIRLRLIAFASFIDIDGVSADLRSGALFQRPPAISFALLFLMMAAHAILESARDALLLGSLSPSALLWSYVGIAAAAVLTTRLRDRKPIIPTLAPALVVAAILTLAFWLLLPNIMRRGGAIAFYVFTGLIVTIIVPRFWLLLASRFTVGEAKRMYGMIGLGGVAGAGAGSALASVLSGKLGASALTLLIAGAVMYLFAALPARALERTPLLSSGSATARTRREPSSRLTEPREYVRLLTVLALVASATLTVIDYLFKSVVAATIPASQLASYFSRVYTTMNVIALVVQLFIVPLALRRLGTHAAALVLPLVVLAGSTGFALAALPLVVLIAKGGDGVLRNSLHRVTMELSYFPLPDDVRNRWKAAADAFGQRGGQAAGALLMLGLLALGAGAKTIALLAACLATAWILLVMLLKKPYVELFRASLRRGSMAMTVSPLGSQTLQAMLEALSSPDDAVVCAAIDFLVHHGNVHLVPAVLVYHPSQPVAMRALAHLVESSRPDIPHILERLTATGSATANCDPAVRMNAITAWMRRLGGNGRSNEQLVHALDDPMLDVRTMAMVGLLRHNHPQTAERARALVESIIHSTDTDAKRSLAQAIENGSDSWAPWATTSGETQERGSERRRVEADYLRQLLASTSNDDVALRKSILRAMQKAPSREYLSRLLPLLGQRRLRPHVRHAIIASCFGDSTPVEKWLLDESLPRAVRRHIPRTLSAFETPSAATALLARYQSEPDSAVRYKILRGLGRMRADHPGLRLEKETLRQIAEENLARAVMLLSWRVALQAQQETKGHPDADAHDKEEIETILFALLKDKEVRALERVFRVLGILHPEAELERVWRGIHSNDPRSRDASLELIEHLDRDERAHLLAMLEPRPDAVRLRGASKHPTPSRSEALRGLMKDRSYALREIALVLLSEDGRKREERAS